MALAVGNVLKIRTVCTSPEQNGVNVGHFRVSAVVGTGRTEKDIAIALSTSYSMALMNVISSSAQFRGIGVQRILPAPPGLEAIETGDAGAGAMSADLLPTSVAGLVKLGTDKAGKRYRGRKYFPFPGKDANDTMGNPEVAYLGDLATIALLWGSGHTVASGGNSVSLVPVIYHRDLETYDDVTGVFVRQFWATQRKRGKASGGDSLLF